MSGPRPDAYFEQLQGAERAAWEALARDPRFGQRFEHARNVLHAYFDTPLDYPTTNEMAGRCWSAIDDLAVATRAAGPVAAELQGKFLRYQLLALVAYRVASDRGASDANRDELYAWLAPKWRATRPELHALRDALDLPQPEGRTAGTYAIKPADLREKIHAAADRLAARGDLITARAIGQGLGIAEERLRIWTRQGGLGELRQIIAAERQRHGQKLRRHRR